MVKIRRPPQRRTKKRRLCSLQNVLMAAVVIVVFRNAFRPDSKDSHEPIHSPMGMADILEQSKGKLPPRKKPPTYLRSPEEEVQQDPSPEEEVQQDSPEEEVERYRKQVLTSDDPDQGSSKNVIVLEKEGTGPTNVAYVKDFVRERNNPKYHGETQPKDSSSHVAQAIKKPSVKPCRALDRDPKCDDVDAPLFVYNSAWFSRTWCGHEIKPDGVIEMTEREGCQDDVAHLFSQNVPPVQAEGMKPVIIKYNKDENLDDSRLETIDCNIPCKMEKGSTKSTSRFVDGEDWEITYTNDPNHSTPLVEHLNYRKDHFYATPSFKSSVPQTSFDWSKFNFRETVPVDWASAKNKGVYLLSDNCRAIRRHKYLGAISNVMPVDKYGTCDHNTDVPDGMTLDTLEGRIQIMKQYRIVLAFGAVEDKDHISSIIWEALISGAVPVIVGAENMQSHLPKDSFISSRSYSDWDELAKKVNEIMNDKSQWEFYQRWRKDEEILAEFDAKYGFARTESSCRLCRWAYAKKYGLGWDSVRQEVTETKLGRLLCTSSSSKDLISKPFEEGWILREHHGDTTVKASGDQITNCNSTTVDSHITDDKGLKVHRVATIKDGITDMTIKDVGRENLNGKIILSLHFSGLTNHGGAYFKNTHSLVSTNLKNTVSSTSIQGGSMKVTVLSDWITSISSPREGVVEIIVEEATKKAVGGNSYPKRIRVISEDVDVKNDKMTEFFPSSFCKKMIKDFVDPLELFVAD